MPAPLPKPTDLTLPYWEAARRHELILPRCRQCEKCFFRPEVSCTHCSSLEWDWVRASGKATLYSYTIVYRPSYPDIPVPYVVAAVDLYEGCTMFSNIVGCPPEDVSCDMQLEVVFDDRGADFSIPQFRPAGT